MTRFAAFVEQTATARSAEDFGYSALFHLALAADDDRLNRRRIAAGTFRVLREWLDGRIQASRETLVAQLLELHPAWYRADTSDDLS